MHKKLLADERLRHDQHILRIPNTDAWRRASMVLIELNLWRQGKNNFAPEYIGAEMAAH